MDESCKRDTAGEAVPRWTHEADMARMERGNKRAWVLNIILAVLLLASWAGFLVYESQFEYVTETTQEVVQTADGESNNRFVGGDIYGGDAAS